MRLHYWGHCFCNCHIPKSDAERLTIGRFLVPYVERYTFQKRDIMNIHKDDTKNEALLKCSLWNENIKDPQWHPFKIITIKGQPSEAVAHIELSFLQLLTLQIILHKVVSKKLEKGQFYVGNSLTRLPLMVMILKGCHCGSLILMSTMILKSTVIFKTTINIKDKSD